MTNDFPYMLMTIFIHHFPCNAVLYLRCRKQIMSIPLYKYISTVFSTRNVIQRHRAQLKTTKKNNTQTLTVEKKDAKKKLTIRLSKRVMKKWGSTQ